MASRALLVVSAALLVVAPLLSTSGCKDVDENDVLGALAASPPDDNGGGGGGGDCQPACEGDAECVSGHCVVVGETCTDECPADDCEVCDAGANECRSVCDVSLCESCDGEGRCESWCDGDQFCVNGSCFDSTGGDCENTNDIKLLQTYDANTRSAECKFNECGEDESCIRDCLVDESGLTQGCAGCYAEQILCYFDNCDATCTADEGGAACQSCIDTHCIPGYCDCAGDQLDQRCTASVL